MSRSKWKVLWSLNNKKETNEQLKDKEILVKNRYLLITPEDLGKKVTVYNGKNYNKPFIITINHIGLKYGEFAITKKPAIYKKKK